MRSHTSRDTHVMQAETAIQLVAFTIGSKLCGADILSVHEILRYPQIEPVESAPDFVAGFIQSRGTSIPVINLGERIRGGALHDPRRQWLLVTKAQERLIAVAVDEVTRIVKIDTASILPAPDLILAGLSSQYISGVCDTEKGLLMVLRLDRLLLDEELAVIRNLDFQPK